MVRMWAIGHPIILYTVLHQDTHLLGHYGWASGWGALEPGSRLRPKTLQVVDVPMIDNRQCERWHREKGINVIIYDEMVCAGYFHGGKVRRKVRLEIIPLASVVCL